MPPKPKPKPLTYLEIQRAADKKKLIQDAMAQAKQDTTTQCKTLLDYERQTINFPQRDEFVYNSQDLSIEGRAKTFIRYIEQSFETLIDMLMNLQGMTLDRKHSKHHHLTLEELRASAEAAVAAAPAALSWVERANLFASMLDMRWLDRRNKSVQTFCFSHQMNRVSHWREVRQYAEKSGVSKLILLFKDMTEQTANEITMLKAGVVRDKLKMNLRTFSLFDLAVNRRKCEIVPHHQLLTPSQASVLVGSTHSGPDALVPELERDIMLRYLDAGDEDVVSKTMTGPDGPVVFLSRVQKDLQSYFGS